MSYKRCFNFKPTVQPVREILAIADFFRAFHQSKKSRTKTKALPSRRGKSLVYNFEN